MKHKPSGHMAADLVVAGAVVLSGYIFGLRPLAVRWGLNPTELQLALPGDDLVPQPKAINTRAVTINAPAAAIWPWLVQMGQGRGGLYSYDGLENLFGLNMRSADRIVPELQNLRVGDVVPFTPAGFGPTVVRIEANHALILRSVDPVTKAELPAGNYFQGEFAVSWALVLHELAPGKTRLYSRWCFDWGAPELVTALVYYFAQEPAHFIMERKMLLGIKERAEATYAPPG